MAKALSYKGSLSRRVKASPILYQHFLRALGEVSKGSRQEGAVYQRLYEVSSKVGQFSVEGISRFYLNLKENNSFCYDSLDSESINPEKFKLGEKIADELEEMVAPLMMGSMSPRKIHEARNVEYEFLFRKFRGD